jgi:hypothetical protein
MRAEHPQCRVPEPVQGRDRSWARRTRGPSTRASISDHVHPTMDQFSARIASSRRFSSKTASRGSCPRPQQPAVLDAPVELAQQAVLLPVEVRPADGFCGCPRDGDCSPVGANPICCRRSRLRVSPTRPLRRSEAATARAADRLPRRPPITPSPSCGDSAARHRVRSPASMATTADSNVTARARSRTVPTGSITRAADWWLTTPSRDSVATVAAIKRRCRVSASAAVRPAT